MDRDADLVARLAAARGSGVQLGLERVERALERLGQPHRDYLVVQVAGTNGKGSTTAFAAAILGAAGFRVGRYTSPHLSRWRERIVVDGRELATDALVAAGDEVERASDGIALTFFELTTLIALVGFARAGVEAAVLEVGLGGRLDATTAAEAAVAGVTGVALDHQAVLGATLDAIAGEKAGIFRSGQRAAIGRSGEPAAVPLLIDAARAARVADLVVVDDDAIARVPAALGLAGPHQRANAALALALIDGVAAATGRPVPDAARAAGLRDARLPGRLETIERDGVCFVIDGAHNPHAARAIAPALPGGRPRAVVLAVSSDKDVAGIALPLVAGADHVVVCATRHERGLPADALAAIVAPHLPRAPTRAAGVVDALERAAAEIGAGGVVVVVGSLFLAGEAREHLLGEPRDAIALTDPRVGDPATPP